MTDAIVRADPRLRRHALILVVVAGALGFAGVYWGLPWLDAARMTQPGVQRIICLTFGAVIVALAVMVVYSGSRIARWGGSAVELLQFPPPAMKVIRDTRPLKGKAAVVLGRSYVVIGWLMVILALILLELGGYIVVMLWPR